MGPRRAVVVLSCLALSACAPAAAAGAGGSASRAAAASGGAAYPAADGGTPYGAPVGRLAARPTVTAFTVEPRVRTGALPSVRFRIAQAGVRRVSVRVAVVPLGGRGSALSVPQGRRSTGRLQRVRWPRGARLAPGRYVVRLHARDPEGDTLLRRARTSGRAVLRVVAPPPPPKPVPAPAPAPIPAPPSAPPPAVIPVPAPAPSGSGVFPVGGPYTIGGRDSGFGAGRPGHIHEGQDISAAAGTPVVAPLSGTVSVRAYQARGAGHYLVLRTAIGDMFFAHLQTGSLLVRPGQGVSGGQRLASVGSTGASSGPHLHFEIWVGGPWRQGGRPVDPLPQLRRWAR